MSDKPNDSSDKMIMDGLVTLERARVIQYRAALNPTALNKSVIIRRPNGSG